MVSATGERWLVPRGKHEVVNFALGIGGGFRRKVMFELTLNHQSLYMSRRLPEYSKQMKNHKTTQHG